MTGSLKYMAGCHMFQFFFFLGPNFLPDNQQALWADIHAVPAPLCVSMLIQNAKSNE